MNARIDPDWKGELIQAGTAVYFTGKTDEKGTPLVRPATADNYGKIVRIDDDGTCYCLDPLSDQLVKVGAVIRNRQQPPSS